jgi:polar amino acid transport system substrate-binding protein
LIREVVHQQAKWKVFGFEEIVVSLNASMREIETQDYLNYLTEQLREHHVRPDTIKVEITESLAMNNAEKMFTTLARLRGAGVSLSLDDFGTGYTSFSYLTKIPADTLKIDKSFIDDILDDKKSQQVVHAIIEVGHALEMDIVAEGVETAKVAKMLIEFGCDYLQGYYFSKPVPVFEMQGQLRPKKDLSGRNPSFEGNSTDILPLHPL